MSSSRLRIAGLSALLLLVGAIEASFPNSKLRFAWREATAPVRASWHTTATPSAPTILFVVLDTVRADHLSACGYERDTSPYLTSLAASGAALSCRAYAPGSWTLPSHASYFTGLEVTEHGAEFSPGGVEISKGNLTVRGLSEEPPTLSEQLAARGYSTHAVSANPVVSRYTGLDRGFDDARFAPQFGDWHGRAVMPALRDSLDAAPTDGTPLFLFVNLADAHEPFDAVGLGAPEWVPARPSLGFEDEPDGQWARFQLGKMDEAEKRAFLAHLVDVYDHGVWQADQSLARILAELEARGWLAAGYRLVVTSDHGEMLGEHDLIDHSVYLWEQTARVPLLVLDTERPDLTLDEPMSALEAYDLVLDGKRHPRPIRATGQPNLTRAARYQGLYDTTSAAVWHDTEKEHWRDGDTLGFDVVADPEELHGTAIEPSELLAEAVEANAALGQRAGTDRDAEAAELLEAMGYLSPKKKEAPK
ncbi:MAG: hypothetical protein EP330_25615 [Deltaproteobacteria bacterium]|nr:MAG: hypothetical protein EP330_25615 [Deltaproteobacteria bacterium]